MKLTRHFSALLCVSTLLLSACSFYYSEIPNAQTLDPADSATLDPDATVSMSNNLVIGGGIPVYSQMATAIVIGTVQEVTGSTARLAVEKILKGPHSGSFFEIHALQESGLDSSLDQTDPSTGTTTWVEDGSELKNGERVLLFLGTNAQNEFVIFAGPAGKYILNGDNAVNAADGSSLTLEAATAQIQSALKSGKIPLPE